MGKSTGCIDENTVIRPAGRIPLTRKAPIRKTLKNDLSFKPMHLKKKLASSHISSFREDLHDPAMIRERRNEDTINIAEVKTSLSNPTKHKQVDMIHTTSPRQTEIEEIVNRIVDAAHPEQVLLFGSTARGTTGPHSDLDFLVIKAGRYNPRKVAGIIYQRMRGIARSMDLVIVTPKQLEECKNSPFSVVYPAVREGRVVYERK
ncbi:MAG: nucleotidyltransferase domain-containing protein [Methanoregula sp.]